MIVTIDSEDAICSSVGERFCCPREMDGAVQLDVYLQEQRFKNWCWAALASALGSYYGTSAKSQYDIASLLLCGDCSEFESEYGTTPDWADKVFRLDRALQAVGCFSHWSAGKPLFDRIRFEINLGRPLCPRIEWHQGSAHYVLVHGYRDYGETILVADSLHGPGEYPLADFPMRYREGGAWTETFWSNCNTKS